nr:hypothetical protein BaRGS_006122 [Batillaria attramentaria]
MSLAAEGGLTFNYDMNDWQPSFLQGNSEVTIDSDRSHYVHTDDMDEAVDALDTHGRVVLCGPPGCGKTSLGHALLRRYRSKQFTPYIIAHVHDWHAHIGEGRRSVVLMDGTLGDVCVNRKEYKQWRAILRNVLSFNKTRDCLLVLTVYPHILRDLHVLDAGSDSPLLESMVVVHLMRDPLDKDFKTEMLTFHLKELHPDTVTPDRQDALVKEILQKDVSGAVFPWSCRQLVRKLELSRGGAAQDEEVTQNDEQAPLFNRPFDPTDIFTMPAEAYVPFLRRMLHDHKHGEVLAVVMSLTMLGLGRFLHNPRRVQPQLETLGFRDFSEYCLDMHADILKEFILTASGDGFQSRVIYDAVGLSLGRSFALPVLLRVCDVRFLVQHVTTTEAETTAEFKVTVGPSPQDRHLLMQTMYDNMC